MQSLQLETTQVSRLKPTVSMWKSTYDRPRVLEPERGMTTTYLSQCKILTEFEEPVSDHADLRRQ